MDPVALDFETCCFAPGMMAPPLVCASTYHPQDGLRLWTTEELPGMCERLFSEPAPVLGHGFAYDACCMLEEMPEKIRRLLWQKYEADEMRDSLTTERIIEIGTGVRGKLALDELARRYGISVQKSIVRTDFGRYYMQPTHPQVQQQAPTSVGPQPAAAAPMVVNPKCPHCGKPLN